MPETNRLGLSRDIPSDVKRVVRQRCGFGCVVCGSAIVQYEHVNPTFSEAQCHDPDRIVLLCGSCHDRVTRGLLSEDSVRSAQADPRPLQRGFSFGPFDFGTSHPTVHLGPLVARRSHTILSAFGMPLLEVAPPEQRSGPFLLSARLYDRSGRELIQIVRNEWRTPTAHWDVTVVGSRIHVRRGPSDIALALRAEPPDALVVETLCMYYEGARLSCSEKGGFELEMGGVRCHAQAAIVEGAQVAVDITNEGIGFGLAGSVTYTGSISSDAARLP